MNNKRKLSEEDALRGLDCLLHDLEIPLDLLEHRLQTLRQTVPIPDQEFAPVMNLIARAKFGIRNCQSTSRLTRGTPQLKLVPVILEEALRPVAESFKGRFEQARLIFSFSFSPAGTCVLADHEALQRILWNLLTNSLKMCEFGDEVRLTGEREGPKIKVVIADTGPGCSDSDYDTIFDPDVSTTDSTGLGLFIVRSLVSALGGRISVGSNLPKGTKFVMELPVYEK